MIWRRSSEITGYHTDTEATETLLTVRPKSIQSPEPVKLGISAESVVSISPWSAAKTMNSLPYIIAARECQRSAMDDLLILNAEGQVAEAISSNVFAFINGEWLTPELNSGCVNGVMRQYILDRTWDYPCRAVNVQADSLHLASAIMLTSATGCKPVSELKGEAMDPEFTRHFIESIHHELQKNPEE